MGGEPSIQPSSYSARMYTPFYVRLHPLSTDDAQRVFADPAALQGCQWSEEALKSAIEFCEGNPWLIQMLANAAWKVALGPAIGHDDVMRAERETQEQLNEWFMPRLLRDLDEEDRSILAAMASYEGNGPIPFSSLYE